MYEIDSLPSSLLYSAERRDWEEEVCAVRKKTDSVQRERESEREREA